MKFKSYAAILLSAALAAGMVFPASAASYYDTDDGYMEFYDDGNFLDYSGDMLMNQYVGQFYVNEKGENYF